MSVNNRTGCNYWAIGSVLHTFVSAQRQMPLLVHVIRFLCQDVPVRI